MRFTTSLLFALVACGGGKAGPSNKTTTTPPAPAAVTLKELQNGDRACYVVVVKDGKEVSMEGDFDLCAGGPHDASALIGKPVTYTTKKGKVLAASCDGNVDCGKSDDVDLVVTISAAP